MPAQATRLTMQSESATEAQEVMPTHSLKRQRQSSFGDQADSPPQSAVSPTAPALAQDNSANGSKPGAAAKGSPPAGQTSNFRNVSACNRCRLRKNRCDQKLPSCASCEKAGVSCVGYDPITKREIPRSYVFYLETRVHQLESLLHAHQIPFSPAENLEHCSRPGVLAVTGKNGTNQPHSVIPDPGEASDATRTVDHADDPRPHKAMKHVSGSTSRRSGGPVGGVSFAHIVFAAVSSSVGEARSGSDKAGVRPSKPVANTGAVAAASGTSMRDSFFGLHTRPTISPAEFPDKGLALKLVKLYFEHANPQIPVLHREDFMRMFDAVYANGGRTREPKELYMLNMVFAIGGGIIMDTPASSSREAGKVEVQAQPEEYHASAIVHLEACLSSSGGGLEELQAVLLLANFALLRPVPPGLWYIVGVAVRLAVDLGLHYEDGKGLGFDPPRPDISAEKARERGRRESVRDLRRRLWWCTYSLDRLVCTCVGRPVSVSDQFITTEFPSMLDDRHITAHGFSPPADGDRPTYKVVARHYFRLRLLQSEILQVLQYQQAQSARHLGQNRRNGFINSDLPSPFLQQFDSFKSWRRDIDGRLDDWKQSAPTSNESGVDFSTEFLDLNYWQAIIMLYRQSLSVPAMFEGEYHTSKEVNTPSIYTAEQVDDQEEVYLKVAKAGQKILRLYRQLHVKGLVNYTYLATHHLFMAGISYLYAIWHSTLVRSKLTMDEVDLTILAATSVLADLIDKCPPAEACRDAFNRTAKATIKMANSTGGFGQVMKDSRPEARIREGSDYMSAKEIMGSRPGHNQRSSLDYDGLQRSPEYRGSSVRDEYRIPSQTSMTQMQQSQPSGRFRQPMAPSVKVEQDGFPLVRSMPATTVNTSSGSDAGAGADGGTGALDPALLPSPSAQGQSPVSATSLTPQSAHMVQFPPVSNTNYNLLRSPSASSYTAGPGGGTMSYADLQGMDFLQGLQDASGGPSSAGGSGAGGGSSSDGFNNMDMGFGLGWEGMNHDFSDGQQMDLFDGFFFGGQQGGSGG